MRAANHFLGNKIWVVPIIGFLECSKEYKRIKLLTTKDSEENE